MARIALNARLLIPNRLEGIGWFTDACYRRIIADHPEHEFLLLFDRTPAPEFRYGPHAKCQRVWPPARRPFLYDAWFDFGIARALKQWGADAFVSTDGMLSRRTSVPQLAVFHDLNFMHHPEWMPAREARYYRSRFPEFGRIASRVVTVSEYSKADIVQQFGVEAGRIDVVYNAPAHEYRPRGEAEGAANRTWSNNNPYFLFVGSLHPRKNLKGLMAAFEMYRDQGGQNDLVIVGESMWEDAHRQQAGVHFVGRLEREQLAEVMRCSVGLVFVPWFEGFGVPIVEAFASGVPVIASNKTAMPEVCGDAAAALVDPGNTVEIAHAMRALESDEAARKQAVERGLKRAADFSWDASAQSFWGAIEKML